MTTTTVAAAAATTTTTKTTTVTIVIIIILTRFLATVDITLQYMLVLSHTVVGRWNRLDQEMLDAPTVV